MNARVLKILVLLLTLALALTGCNLIEIDAKMQAEEDIAKLDKAYDKTVARYEGGEVSAEEAMSLFNSLYNEMYYMYQYYFGMEMTADQVRDLMETALQETVRSKIVAEHFDQSEVLDDAALEQVQIDAQAAYDEAYDSLYEMAAGDDAEAKNANTLVMLKEIGMDAEINSANTLRDAKVEKMIEILQAEISELTEEELLSAYEARVAEDEDAYALDDGTFESLMMEDEPDVFWVPAGYRTVKHILLVPEEALMTDYLDALQALEDQQDVLEDLQSELETVLDDDAEQSSLRTEDAVKVDIEICEGMVADFEADVESAKLACLENVKPLSDEIYARLAEGEDFEALMAEYGEDPGMKNEPTMSRGYYVRETSANWEKNFTGGAMALEKVGDYSAEPVLSGSGVHIIYYASDVAGGAVPFEEVRDSLHDSTLDEKKNEHSEEIISQWIDSAKPSYDAEAFEKAVFDGAL